MENLVFSLQANLLKTHCFSSETSSLYENVKKKKKKKKKLKKQTVKKSTPKQAPNRAILPKIAHSIQPNQTRNFPIGTNKKAQ